MKVDQDLVFSETPTGVPQYFIDLGVPYIDKSNTFSLSFHWVPRDDFTVGADLSHTIAKASTDYTVVFEGVPLSSFANLEASESSLSLILAKKLPKDWEIGFRLYFNIYNDTPPNDFLDGDLFSSTFTIKRYF